MKTLEFGWGEFIPPRLLCNNLEQLILVLPRIGSVDLIEFMANHMSIKKMRYHGHFGNADILSLATIKWNVTKATIRCNHDVTAENIIHMIRNSPNLKNLRLLMAPDAAVRLSNAISELLPNFPINEWTMERLHEDRVVRLKKRN